jgi:polysaccharide chain length determinant protein (PEP-CTERM system associated)
VSSEARTGTGRPGDAVNLDEEDGGSISRAQVNRYLHAPLRRPLLVVVPFVVILLVSVAALFALPKRYRSSTLILVESEKVPETFVPKVATQDKWDNLEALRPEILSRTRLEVVLDETRPYPEISSRTQAVELMRRRVILSRSGNDGFTIEFIHSDPHMAQRVTDRIASLFIEESTKKRAQQVEGAVDFLVTQVNAARAELEGKDAALRRFKQERMGTLPEQLQTNLTTMGMLQQELRAVDESLLFARDRLEARERSFRRSSESPAGTSALGDAEVAELRRQLYGMRLRYTDEHPDVRSLRLRIAQLEARVAEAPSADSDPADPSTRSTREDLVNASLEIKNLEEKRRGLEARIASLRARVEETPRTEQELATLMRDYQQLNENYTTLLSKQLEAQMAGRLERRWKGDRFRMLDPANLPEKPYFPTASLILGLGAALGIFAGLAISLAAEFLDPTIKDLADLPGLRTYPILACISHLPDPGESATP